MGNHTHSARYRYYVVAGYTVILNGLAYGVCPHQVQAAERGGKLPRTGCQQNMQLDAEGCDHVYRLLLNSLRIIHPFKTLA